MVGLDCRDLKQFDVILTADSNQFFPREQVMYIYTKSNIIVSYTPQGVFTTGKWLYSNIKYYLEYYL